MRELHEAVFAQHFGDPTATMDMESWTGLSAVSSAGRPRLVRSRSSSWKHVAGVYESNAMFVERMADVYNTVLNEWLRPLRLQPAWVLGSGPSQLITGDVPVVRTSNGGYRINVALGDAEMVYMALAPRAGVAFSSKELEPAVLEPLGVQKMNSLVWRSAHRHVAAHPSADWRRSLALLRSASFADGARRPGRR